MACCYRAQWLDLLTSPAPWSEVAPVAGMMLFRAAVTTIRIEIAEFLSHGADGPEHQALLRLIGILVEEPERLETLTH
jgi:hypothetical protein